jgi:serine/threonine-protein kinase
MPSHDASPAPSPSRHRRDGWLSPAAGKDATLEVAQNDRVAIFPKAGSDTTPIGIITDGVSGAYGLFVDAARDLYVVNAGNNTVTVYPPGATSPSVTYSKKLHRPLYCVVDASSTLYVGNADGGDVVEYAAGSTEPMMTIQTPGSEADGLAIDGSGNLYVAYRGGSSKWSVERFAPGAKHGKVLHIVLNQPQELAIDDDGRLLATETGGTDTIDVFPPGHVLPSRKIALSAAPTQIVFGDRNKHLYISTLGDQVLAMHYPHGPVRVKITSGLAYLQGMAVTPARTPQAADAPGFPSQLSGPANTSR